MPRVKLDSVRKVYGNGYIAVHGLSLEISDGELVVLVGPSGCGKSTTLRMIAGLESISSGHLWIGDRLVNGVAPNARDVAMVFQNYALYPHMSVFDNMGFALKMRKLGRREIEGRVREAAEVLGIVELLDRRPRELSGGQRQRVAVGRAIVRQPQVFLFDEPLSNLDAKLRLQMRKEISRLHRQLDATMVYVTHDQAEAMTLGDRIVAMHEGHARQVGKPLEVYERPADRFVAGFIGSPGMNLIEGSIEAAGSGATFRSTAGELTLGVGALPGGLPPLGESGLVVLGILPEHIYVEGSGYVPDRVARASLPLDVVEPLGSELILYAGRDGLEVVARVRAEGVVPVPGDEIGLLFDLSKVRFFEVSSGLAVSGSGSVSFEPGP